MISCIEWVPKGVADPTPKKYEMSAVELELLENQAKMEAAMQEGGDDDEESDESDDNEEKPQKSSMKLPKIDPNTLPPELRMDEYSDDEDETDNAVQGSMLGHMLVGHDHEMIGTRLDEEGMPVEDIAEENEANSDEEIDEDDDDDDEDNDDEDDDELDDVPDTREYMPVDIAGLQAMGISHAQALDDDDEGDDDDDSDLDDVNLSPDDAIVVLAKTEDDFASLEVHVYEETTGNLFVHHDIPLPSFPLCLAHGDINHEGGAGNYIAVGSFEPGIEVWNLDVLNVLEPTCILGGEDTSAADELMKANMMRAAGGKKLKKHLPQQSGNGMRPGSHTDAVMALSWNKIHRQVIASGSADNTVKIWDITKIDKPNAATFTHHKNKVQAVQWHPSEGTLLATGSYDRTVAVVDARSADYTSCKRVKISADCEALAWDPHHSQYLTAATEDGVLTCWDVRQFDKPVWSLVADEFGGVSDLSYNPNVPGMLATCAINKTVTLWDTYSKEKQEPSLLPPIACGNKSMDVGKLYTLAFYSSSPWLMGCGGGGNQLALWDMTREEVIQKRFGCRIGQQQPVQEEELKEVNKEEDFEAMMAVGDTAMEKMRENASKQQNKKKGKKKKKGAHKS